VLGPHAEAAVVAAQLAHVLVQRLGVVGAVHERDQGRDQPVPVRVHHRREQVPQGRVLEEEQGVEVARELVGFGLDECERLLDQAWVEGRRHPGSPRRRSGGWGVTVGGCSSR
jgi:hypothetical protein